MHPILLSLPDDLAHWRGTAAELADRLNGVLEGIPSLVDDAGLAKVAEMVHATDLDSLAGMIPTERPRTRAEEVVAKYRHGRRPEEHVSARTPSIERSLDVSAETFGLTPQSAPPARCQRRGPRRAPPHRPHRVHAVVPRAGRCRDARRDERRHPRDPRGRVDPGAPGRAHTKRKVTMTTPTMNIMARRPALPAGHDNELDVLVRIQAPEAPALASRPRRMASAAASTRS